MLLLLWCVCVFFFFFLLMLSFWLFFFCLLPLLLISTAVRDRGAALFFMCAWKRYHHFILLPTSFLFFVVVCRDVQCQETQCWYSIFMRTQKLPRRLNQHWKHRNWRAPSHREVQKAYIVALSLSFFFFSSRLRCFEEAALQPIVVIVVAWHTCAFVLKRVEARFYCVFWHTAIKYCPLF